MKRTAALTIGALLLGACALPDDSATETTASPVSTIVLETPDTTLILEEPMTNPSTQELLQDAVGARVDLASRLGVDENEIQVTTLSRVTWRDGSLGCPVEGVTYTQALVDGTLVILDHEGESHYYHKGVGGEQFLCEEPAEGSFTLPKEGNEELELTPPPGYDE
jgi:hypothetical protein